MRKNVILIWMLAIVLLLSVSGVFGQSNPKAGYLEFAGENQSRNLPAGIVQDPASHLTYLIDTGYNLREGNAPDVALATLSGDAVKQDVFGADGSPGADGEDDLDAAGNGFNLYTNFITISNTHPTMAVTVHFRYFNDNCDDILDFLVVLTCNDTLVFDPWNFVIPDTGGENTSNRLYFKSGAILQPMTAQDWGSGRFIITASASGTSRAVDPDDEAEILFPNEWSGSDHCNIKSGNDFTTGLTMDEILSGAFVNKGIKPGLVADNLHVFNSSQISFNFLLGSLTTAVPASSDTLSGWKSMSYGVAAWGRPAVDRANDAAPLDPSAVSGKSDADGPAAPTGHIVTGGELVYQSNRLTQNILNTLSLRSDVHGGDNIWDTTPSPPIGGYSYYGALGTTSFLGSDPDRILQHFMSIADDYNGTSNAAVSSQVDRTANIVPAASTYVMQLYDNDEDLYYIEPGAPLNVSPPVVDEVVELKLVCFCLRTFLTTTISPGTNVDSVTISDLNSIFATGSYADDILNGGGVDDNFDGFIAGGSDPGDSSHGWIRWVRDNNNVVDLSPAGLAASVGATVTSIAHDAGTSTFAQTNPFHVDLAQAVRGPSFLTQLLQVTVFQPGEWGYGVANWGFAVASDAEVSETGVPETNYVPDGY